MLRGAIHRCSCGLSPVCHPVSTMDWQLRQLQPSQKLALDLLKVQPPASANLRPAYSRQCAALGAFLIETQIRPWPVGWAIEVSIRHKDTGRDRAACSDNRWPRMSLPAVRHDIQQDGRRRVQWDSFCVKGEPWRRSLIVNRSNQTLAAVSAGRQSMTDRCAIEQLLWWL
jgi:hypothetical protein